MIGGIFCSGVEDCNYLVYNRTWTPVGFIRIGFGRFFWALAWVFSGLVISVFLKIKICVLLKQRCNRKKLKQNIMEMFLLFT